MKRFMMFFVCAVLLVFVGISCSTKASPTDPDATATTQATATAGITGSSTATAVVTDTATAVATDTATAAATDTATAVVTDTPTTAATHTATTEPTSTGTITATPQHTFVSKFGQGGLGDDQINYVVAMCHDENNNIYLADQNAQRIKVFNSAGVYQMSWTATVTGDTSAYPAGICYDGSANIYITDAGNHCVKQYTKDGTYVRKFGVISHFGGGEPRKLVFRDNVLYVMGAHLVAKYSPTGTFLGNIGVTGTGSGQIMDCYSIYVDGAGNIYCGTVNNGKIVEYDSTGAFVREWNHSWASDIVMDAGGNLLISAASSSIVKVYQPDGTFLHDIGTYGSGDGQFMQPYAMSVDSAGFLFVTDTSRDDVQKFTR